MTKNEMKTDESKHIINLVIKDKLKKEAEEYLHKDGTEAEKLVKDLEVLYLTKKQLNGFFAIFKQIYIDSAEPREKRIAELEKENAELKGEANSVLDNWCRGDDPCPHLKKRDEQLTEAKEIIKKFSEFANLEVEYDPEHPQEHTDLWNELCKDAEQFLNSEVEK